MLFGTEHLATTSEDSSSLTVPAQAQLVRTASLAPPELPSSTADLLCCALPSSLPYLRASAPGACMLPAASLASWRLQRRRLPAGSSGCWTTPTLLQCLQISARNHKLISTLKLVAADQHIHRKECHSRRPLRVQVKGAVRGSPATGPPHLQPRSPVSCLASRPCSTRSQPVWNCSRGKRQVCSRQTWWGDSRAPKEALITL